MAYFRARCKKCNFYMWACNYQFIKSDIYKHMRKCRAGSFEDFEIKRITQQEFLYLCRNKHNPDLWNVVRNGIRGINL